MKLSKILKFFFSIEYYNYKQRITILGIKFTRPYIQDIAAAPPMRHCPPLKELKNDIAIVAIAKNEASYIEEWIEYHKLIGVSKFYIYDNESTDNLKERLEKYIKTGLVQYTFFPGEKMQMPAYQDAIDNYKFDNKYMAIIDCDEFIVPTSNEKLIDILEDTEQKQKNFGGLAISWAIYGSSGRLSPPPGLVIENYLYRAKKNFLQNKHIKTILNPRKVYKIINPHYAIYYKGFFSYNTANKKIIGPFAKADYSKIRINHYFTKSYEEFKLKRARGMADHKKGELCDMQKFKHHDKNEVFDNCLEQYASRIKKALKIN